MAKTRDEVFKKMRKSIRFNFIRDTVKRIIRMDRQKLLDKNEIQSTFDSILSNPENEFCFIEGMMFIQELFAEHFSRRDFYEIYSYNEIKNWTLDKKFTIIFAMIFLNVKQADAEKRGLSSNLIERQQQKLKEILHSKKLCDCTVEELEKLEPMKMLQLLFIMQSEGAKKFLKKQFETYELSESANAIEKTIVITSLPNETDKDNPMLLGIDENAELEAEHLLNIYAKFAIIDEQWAVNIAKVILMSPSLTINNAIMLLQMLFEFRYSDEGTQKMLECLSSVPSFMRQEKTQKLQLAFFDGLPKKVREKILEIEYYSKRYEPNPQ